MRRPAAWMLMFRLATAAATQEAATGPKQVKITVLAYDFVGLNRDTRRDSSRKLGEIFQPAGIPIEWVDCQSGKQLLSEARCRNLERTDVFLRLVDGGDVKAKDVHVNYLGITEPEWGGRGRITILTGISRK